MALYTGKGDDGKTSTFSCDQRLSKSSKIAEALGVLDEANSYLGVVKVKCRNMPFFLENEEVENIIDKVQKDLFIVQAEAAGAPYKIKKSKVLWLEKIIEKIEKELPPINKFYVPGGSELSATLDFARTLVRRAERRAVAVHEEGIQKLGKNTLAYLNRLSSLLYALARLANARLNIEGEHPDYK